MKKILSLLAALSVASAGFAADLKIASIDSLSIMQKSKEGQDIAVGIQKSIELFQSEVKKSQKELGDFQESINKQSKALSKDALEKKKEEFENKKKKLERNLSDKEEALRGDIQRKQLALRDKQLGVVNEVFASKKLDMLVDKQTPGVLCISDTIDETASVLKAVDEKYMEEKSKKTIVKNDETPKAKTVPQVKVA